MTRLSVDTLYGCQNAGPTTVPLTAAQEIAELLGCRECWEIRLFDRSQAFRRSVRRVPC
jgi:hypothetical protein